MEFKKGDRIVVNLPERIVDHGGGLRAREPPKTVSPTVTKFKRNKRYGNRVYTDDGGWYNLKKLAATGIKIQKIG